MMTTKTDPLAERYDTIPFRVACMTCDSVVFGLTAQSAMIEAAKVGWHDIHEAAEGGAEPGVTHLGTCWQCCWENKRKHYPKDDDGK